MTRGLPVHGYTDQPQDKIDQVNANKILEEQILRVIDRQQAIGHGEQQRWCSIARTHIQQGFMALNRGVFLPERVKLEGDPT